MVYTDHKNLTYKHFNTELVMRWRLIIEAFGPELKCIKGEDNVLANALYGLKIGDNQDILNIYQLYGYNDENLPDSAYPIRYHDIAKAQKTDAKLNHKLISHKDYTLNTFHGGNQNHHLIWRCDQMCDRTWSIASNPDFNAPFDASKLQIGAVISQKGQSIAFYSRNMNSAQHNYTTTEK